MDTRIRTLIVDDEPWARKRLSSLLETAPDFELIGECADAEQAVEMLASTTPDLVLLDIEMPGLSGFDVLEAIEPERWPLVVFVTAYDKYAVQAFEIEATDYLLKPFDESRFHRTLERVRRDLEQQTHRTREGLEHVLRALGGAHRYLTRLAVKSTGRIVFVRSQDVDWCEATGNYVTLHVGRESHLIRESMNNLEAKLDPSRFVRIHRSTIINLDRAKEMRPWFRGEQIIVLTDGTELTVGRAFRDRLRRWLGNEA